MYEDGFATAKNKIDYINTHGTSTPVGDITELKRCWRRLLELMFQKLVQLNLYQVIH